jgi:hypothetical protein
MHLPALLFLLMFFAHPLLASEVKHGSELKRGVNCGLPEGTTLKEDTTSEFSKPEVITGKTLGAVKTTHSEGVVKFVRCRFTCPGYVPPGGTQPPSPGTERFTVDRAGTGSVELEDCEVYGGQNVAVRKVDRMTRTYITGGNDLIRAPEGESHYTEVLAEMLLLSSPESHSDVMQVTFTDAPADKPLVAAINLTRCQFNASVPEGTKNANGAIQIGFKGSNNGVTGEITDCKFDSGAFSLAGGDIGPLGKPLVLRGNQFGRNAKFGPINPNWHKNNNIDQTNVWADTGDPVPARTRRSQP